MLKKKILLVIGTRPEGIKMAPVAMALRQMQSSLNVRICLTAQHRELLDDVCGVFGLEPEIDLNLMEPDQTLASFAAKALGRLDEVYASEKPDLVLAQGDTTTVLCAAQAAFYRDIPFGHVEAGLRTYNKRSPFPEEFNRAAISHLADLHFAPTERAKENLLRAGVSPRSIHVTGNPVIDAVQYAAERTGSIEISDVNRAALESNQLILITTHRRENFGQPMRNICRALKALLERYPDAHAVLPVHPNPNVQMVIQEELSKSS